MSKTHLLPHQKLYKLGLGVSLLVLLITIVVSAKIALELIFSSNLSTAAGNAPQQQIEQAIDKINTTGLEN